MRVWWTVLVLVSVALAGCSGGGEPADEPPQSAETESTSATSTTTASTTTSTTAPAERRDPVTWTVTMEDVEFKDSPATIQRGDTVRWVHEDGATTHRVETREGAPEDFDSGDMTEATNSEFEFTFDASGAYEYFCRYHEGVMSESIEVRESFDGTPEDPGGSQGGAGGNGTAGNGTAGNGTDPSQAGEPREPVTWEITIEGSAFVDGSITVQAGDTVRWVHRDAFVPHTVTADDGEFDSGPVYMVEAPVLGTFESSFDEPGAFPYHCEVHPSMQQTITVVDVYQPRPGSEDADTTPHPANA